MVLNVWYSENHGNDPWYCMYESYIEARDSPLRSVKDYCIGKHMACTMFSFLME